MTAAPRPFGDPSAHDDGGRPALAGGRGNGDLGRRCRCGHGRQAHEHYRSGTDCGLCDCRRFRGSLLGRLRRR